MASKGLCFYCKAETHQFVNGWMLKNGSLTQLCNKCGFAYVNGIFCENFHKEEEGWRDCGFCGKPLHCRCLISCQNYAPLDFGGIGCRECIRVLDECNAPGGKTKLLKETAEKYKTNPTVSAVSTTKVGEFLSPGSLQAPTAQFGEEPSMHTFKGHTSRQTTLVMRPCRPLVISPTIMEALRPLPNIDYSRTLAPIGTHASLLPHRKDQPKSQEPDSRNEEIIVHEPEAVGPSAVVPSQVEITKEKGKRLELLGGESEVASELQIPKKIKLLVDDCLQKIVDVATSLEQAKVLGYNLTPQSLGLVETPSGLLVPATVLKPKEIQVKVPKKRGRPVGSKNKPKSTKVDADELLNVPAGEASSSLTIEGRRSRRERGQGQGQRKGKEEL